MSEAAAHMCRDYTTTRYDLAPKTPRCKRSRGITSCEGGGQLSCMSIAMSPETLALHC
jgi:hypothetical protein